MTSLRARTTPAGLRRGFVRVGAAATVVALAACQSATGAGTTQNGAPVASTPQVSQAVVLVDPGDPGATIAPTHAVKVVAARGTLGSVVITDAAGSALPGAMSADKKSWTATPGSLDFGGVYSVNAAAVDDAGRTGTTVTSFKVKEPKWVKPNFTNSDGTTYGVAMPVILKFSRAPKDKAAAERLLTVQTTPAVQGSWSWVNGKEIHWRPQNYWPANTQVTATANLKGAELGSGIFGKSNTTTSFKIGRQAIEKVNLKTHQMQVIRDGAVVRTVPITGGKAGFITRSGTKVILSRESHRVMDSTTIDIPANSPDAYRLDVKYAMRVTWSGEFLHAAPWSVSSQGRRNVSHGCVGMSMSNAEWLFDNSKVGDPVEVTGTSRSIEKGNGITDWNVSWAEWVSNSALS